MSSQTVKQGNKRKTFDETPQLDLKKIRRGAKELRPGFGDERYDETEYYFQNGLRKVYPYFYTFTTFAKGRWVGEVITDVFAKEFRAYPAAYYEKRMKEGRFLVNNASVSCDYRIKDNDLLANTIHRHEVPVLAAPIKIIHDDKDMLVIDKPPSIPVHPCGRYRHNSIIFLLAKEYDIHNLHTLHRLDRLTSGLLMFAKNVDRARKVEEMIRGHTLRKQYLCRVEGEFPAEEKIECNAKIDTLSHKIGVCGVTDTGRECTTFFTRLSYNGKSSVLLCEPKQGRMHQIRVHLQYLGYPILNDPLYNSTVFGPLKGKGGLPDGLTQEKLIENLMKVHTLDHWLTELSDSDLPSNDTPEANDTETPEADSKLKPEDDPLRSFPTSLAHYLKSDPQFQKHVRSKRFDSSKITRDEDCRECNAKYIDPRPHDLLLYLHCYKYSGEDFSYEASYPNWAKDDWMED